MKKLLMITAAVALFGLPAAVSAQKGYVVFNDGKKQDFETLSVDKKDADSFRWRQGHAGGKFSKNDVKYYKIEKPKEIADADAKFAAKDYAEAAKGYVSALQTKLVYNGEDTGLTYMNVGWEIYCTYQTAQAFKLSGNIEQALKLFAQLDSATAVIPEDNTYIQSAQLQLGETYLAGGKLQEADAIAKKLITREDPGSAFTGYLLRGQVLKAEAQALTGAAKKDKLKDAALSFFGASLLFEKSANRPQALYESWLILTELNDAHASVFKDLLMKNYPNSEYTKKLK